MSKWKAYPVLVLKLWLILAGIIGLFQGCPLDLLSVLLLARMQHLQSLTLERVRLSA